MCYVERSSVITCTVMTSYLRNKNKTDSGTKNTECKSYVYNNNNLRAGSYFCDDFFFPIITIDYDTSIGAN